MAIQAGISNVSAGFLASVFNLISLPFSMTIPSLTTRLSPRYRLIMLGLISSSALIGISMLLIQTNNFMYWLIINILIGTAVSALFPYLMVMSLLLLVQLSLVTVQIFSALGYQLSSFCLFLQSS